MALDLISDVLRSVRLDGTVYFEARMSGTWAIEVAASDAASFHYVTSGTAWIRIMDGDWRAMPAGRTVVLPHGHAHALSSGPETEPDSGPGVDGRTLLDQVDASGVVRLGDREPDRGDPQPGPTVQLPETRIICGHFATDRNIDHPLLTSLPSLVATEAEQSSAWTAVAELVLQRSTELGPGSKALTDRLAEVLLLDVLTNVEEGQAGFVRSLRDPMVASALQAIHDKPERAWTLATLAGEVAVSPSTLSHRFAELVGESPMRYVSRWRLHVAAGLLRDTSLTTEQIAHRVGYGSPFSLSKAFSREFGLAPSFYRVG